VTGSGKSRSRQSPIFYQKNPIFYGKSLVLYQRVLTPTGKALEKKKNRLCDLVEQITLAPSLGLADGGCICALCYHQVRTQLVTPRCGTANVSKKTRINQKKTCKRDLVTIDIFATPQPHICTQTQTTDTQTHRHTDTQTHRHTDTQTHKTLVCVRVLVC